MLNDTADTALIADLNRTLDGWRRAAHESLALAEQRGARITELEALRDRDALQIAELALRRGAAELRIAKLEQLKAEELARNERMCREIERLDQLVEQLRCGDLVAFSDGELAPERAEAFRGHLVRCNACAAGLVDLADLDARLSSVERPGSP